MNSLFGWKDLSPKLRKWFNQLDKAVVLFPHTSRWDTFTILTYTMVCTELHNRIWVMIRRSKINKIADQYLYSKYFRMLDAPTLEEYAEGQRGFIKRVIKTFQKESKYLIFMSPEGGTLPRPWKSGYYILARELEIPITVVGFDYVEHRITAKILIKPDWKTLKKTGYGSIKVEFPENNYKSYRIKVTWEQLQSKLQKLSQKAMGDIIPLHPNKSFVPIRSHLETPTSTYTATKIIVFLIVIVIIIVVALIINYQLSNNRSHKNRHKSKKRSNN